MTFEQKEHVFNDVTLPLANLEDGLDDMTANCAGTIFIFIFIISSIDYAMDHKSMSVLLSAATTQKVFMF